ncbi:aminotransferase class I/II-fold pyridoxal phosphate-dependent enzyme [Pelagicoccus enzymogenes]|uniref:aminotransferase class I/II-fold pyridoxal phosphate-dependent enzyme n=1 Tax=Pelagicoccus enzymogenes TaxID=2773457 RepID=UPI00280FBF38|nr:aminotransferase class I/II-fold pyridoxal phosphate-dependent enzyme [Pelagicoccus enzymogenes]MDQ8196578.1 aminotransferase class I/II-fold pyridoxal phosphate-dependent enzyme [Pelagicoccus enzymogenes]
MSAGQHIPLGQAIPDSLHAVSVSIPTMADVIGYEEKRPATIQKLKAGYPRFVLHTCLREIEAHWKRLFDTPEHSIWLTSSESMAKRLQNHLAPAPSKLVKHRGVSGLRIPTDADLDQKAKSYLQHVGGFLSGRQAEDYLVAEGLRDAAEPEPLFAGEDAAAAILETLSPLLDTETSSIVLSNTGMNAFFAAFEAVRSIQSPRGRSSWIKIGWLYTDTMHILDKLSGHDAANVELLDIFDLDQLEQALLERGDRIAGIVTEAPTNPLIQTMDLERIRKLATQHGVYLLVDPTVASPANVNVEPYSDIIINSLTKYAGNEGDVMLGAVAVTDQCPDKDAILNFIKNDVEPPYARDLARIAYQLPAYAELVGTVNQNTAEVVAFLKSHPKVKAVHWAKEKRSRSNFQKIARHPDAIGGLISFEVKADFGAFYDATPLPKGPSFGMKSTLLCPYIFLAHYSLVNTEEGLKTLEKAGITPELMRLAVGDEPVSEIISALKQGLDS